jgi:hypothetical protein
MTSATQVAGESMQSKRARGPVIRTNRGVDAATGREQGEGEPIDGKAFAAGQRQRTGKGLAALVAKGGARSRLATALVCADPASQVSEQASKANLLALIAKLSAHAPVKGAWCNAAA